MSCPIHGGIWHENCTRCRASAGWRSVSLEELERIARTPVVGMLCRRCGNGGIVNRRVHKIWHKCWGGTFAWNPEKYDRLMEAR